MEKLTNNKQNCKSFNARFFSMDDFEIIEKSEIELTRNSSDMTCKSDGSLKLESIQRKKQNPLKYSFFNELSNLKNQVKYNYLSLNKQINFNKFSSVKIFHRQIIEEEENASDALQNEIKNIIMFTYRSYISPPLQGAGYEYTTDCGWGCMIRTAQMMLSTCLFKILGPLNVSKTDIVSLFLDNHLKIKELFMNHQFTLLNQFMEKTNYIENFVAHFQMNDLMNNTMDNDYLVPPFSIHNIIKVGTLLGRNVGDWFSDVNMAYIFKYINDELNVFDKIEIFNFNEGFIDLDEIVNECLVETTKDAARSFRFKNKFYELKKKGIIFISVKLGLNSIASEYYSSILNIFNIPFNLGIIGGKSNSAHYFIGVKDSQLIYLDPHLNQKAVQSLIELENSFGSYIPKYFYPTKIDSISPAFTVGLYFTNVEELEAIKVAIDAYSAKDYSLFSIKSDKKTSNNLVVIDEKDEDDGFCLVSLKEDLDEDNI